MRILATLLIPALLSATDYYAAPAGVPSCDGSIGCPWDLQTALNAPLLGGDRLLLNGGTYSGSFSSALNGNGAQIVIASAPGPQPRINGTLAFTGGGYVTVSGVEFYNSNANRLSTAFPDCIDTYAPSVHLIHNIIHDCGSSGVGFWSANLGGIAYGNLIYYQGYDAPDRGHGHGVYAQSTTGKLIQDNIFGCGFGWGMHAYTQGGNIDYITLRGNILSQAGCLASTGPTENVIIEGYVTAQAPVIDANVAYYSQVWQYQPINVDLGSYANYPTPHPGVANATITNNKFIGGSGLVLNGTNTQTGNLISPPNSAPGLTVVVRPDAPPSGTGVSAEPGRANVAVINVKPTCKHCTQPTSTLVPVASLGYANGEWVTVATAEDYFGAHRSFQVSGGNITLSLTGWTVATPVGWSKPATTLPSFGAFILRRSF